MVDAAELHKRKLKPLAGFAVLFVLTLVIEEYRNGWLGVFGSAESRKKPVPSASAASPAIALAYVQADALNVRRNPSPSGEPAS